MSTTLAVVAAALVLVVLAVAAMAVGVIMRRPCLRGSCGGAAVQDAKGRSIGCATCPNRRQAPD